MTLDQFAFVKSICIYFWVRNKTKSLFIFLVSATRVWRGLNFCTRLSNKYLFYIARKVSLHSWYHSLNGLCMTLNYIILVCEINICLFVFVYIFFYAMTWGNQYLIGSDKNEKLISILDIAVPATMCMPLYQASLVCESDICFIRVCRFASIWFDWHWLWVVIHQKFLIILRCKTIFSLRKLNKSDTHRAQKNAKVHKTSFPITGSGATPDITCVLFQ